MNLKCAIGLHAWIGCKCAKCGKTRDEGHAWTNDCETCAQCGKTRRGVHNWDGCVCLHCGATRDEGHDWAKDCEVCARCRKSRTSAHVWDGPRCLTCGKRRPVPEGISHGEGHDSSTSATAACRTHRVTCIKCYGPGCDSCEGKGTIEVPCWVVYDPKASFMGNKYKCRGCGKSAYDMIPNGSSYIRDLARNGVSACPKCGCVGETTPSAASAASDPGTIATKAVEVRGYCSDCGEVQKWLLKDGRVECPDCETRRHIPMPPQGTIKAPCASCGCERDWVVGADGVRVCLACGVRQQGPPPSHAASHSGK